LIYGQVSVNGTRCETAGVLAPAADIQAIMTVIRRRTRSFGHGESECLDLHDTNLSGASLSEANLLGADLRNANLSEAELWKTNLSGADLSEAEHLTQDQVEMTMYGDENTRLPPDLKPPEHWWHVKTDEQIEED
jgi:hypothetical protein